MDENTGLTEAEAERLLLGGVLLHSEGHIDFEAWFGPLAHRIAADVRPITEILRAPRGLSVVLPARRGDARLGTLLGDLAAQTAEAGVCEIVVAPYGEAAVSGSMDMPSDAPGLLVLAGSSTRCAAVNAGFAASSMSHVVVVEPGHRLAPDFVGGLLRSCADNTIVFAHASDEGAVAEAVHGSRLTLQFAGENVLAPEHAAFLTPWLTELPGKAMPRIVVRFARLREALGPEADAVFWCEVVAAFHPAFRLAPPLCRYHSATAVQADAGSDAVMRALTACEALAEIARATPHPILDKVVRTFCGTVRATVTERPELGYAAFRAAKDLRLPAQDIDACFHGVPLSGATPTVSPLISVIVPVFNTAAEIDRCLDAILNQTLANIEILCVDDCSSDGSLDRLKWHAERDSRIRILSHGENRGPGGARNAALAASRGRYISFIDSDDEAAATFLERLWQGTRDEYFDIVVCGAAVTGLDGTVLNRIDTDTRTLDPVDPAANRLTLLNPNLWNKLWRRSLFFHPTPLLFPEKIYFQDSATVPRLVRRVSTINKIGDVLYKYLIRIGSITRSFGPRSIMSYLAIFDCVKEDLILMNEYARYEADFKSWVDGNLNYHIRSISGLPIEPDVKESYLRHVDIVRHGYLAEDDAIRRDMKGEATALLAKHHGV